MSNIQDLKTALQSTPPITPIGVSIGTSVWQISAADFDTALGVVYQPPPTIAYTAVVNTSALNFRASPSLKSHIISELAYGTQVDVIAPGVSILSEGVKWLNIRVGGGAIVGYVAAQYLSRVEPPPAPVVASKIGVHLLEDATPVAEAFLATGTKLASATVVDNAGLANQLAQTVPYVIFRKWPDNEGIAIPDDPIQAEQYGRDWVTRRFNADNQLGDVDLQVYLQLVNEVAWTPGHGGFWLGLLKELTAMGRKGAMGAYSIGTPEPEQWATLRSALQFAKANGHIACLHAYSKAGTAPGTLSDASDLAFYEARFARLYAAVPENAQPPLVLSECAHEFARGKFEGTDNLLAFAKAFQGLVAPFPYVVGFNIWTAGSAGGWADACIDSALPALADYIKKNSSLNLDVPYRSQEDPDARRYRNDCGPACVAMLIDWQRQSLGLPVQSIPIDTLSSQTTLATRDNGLATWVLVPLAAKYGLRLKLVSDLSIDSITAELSAGRPVVALISYAPLLGRENQADRSGHFVIVTGIDDQFVIVNDPDFYASRRDEGHNFRIPRDQFEAAIVQSPVPRQGLLIG